MSSDPNKIIYGNKKFIVTKEYVTQTNNTQKLEYFVKELDKEQPRVFNCRNKAIHWAKNN